MSSHIEKNDPKRWFYVQNNGTGENSLICFGNLGEVGGNELETGQSIITNFLTEEELESAVNTIAENTEYYMDAVELESDKFMMPSGLYVYGVRITEPEPEEFE